MLLNEQEFKTKTENHAICEELMVNQKYSRGKKTKSMTQIYSVEYTRVRVKRLCSALKKCHEFVGNSYPFIIT
jgi:hypothetical protein